MIRRYRPRRVEVSAAQWNGNNLAEMDDLAGARFAYRPEPNAEDIAFIQVTNDVWVSLGEDRWVVRDAAGALRVCSPAEFTADYELAEGTPEPQGTEHLTAGWPRLNPPHRNTLAEHLDTFPARPSNPRRIS